MKTIRHSISTLLLIFAAVFVPIALAAPGDVDTGFNRDVNGVVYSTALQPDGKIIIGGNFANVGGTVRNCIARLYADGTLDPSFNPNANDWVYCTAVQPDGKIVIGGPVHDC